MYASETSKHRDLLAPYCTGAGLDIGFGGDPITVAAIRTDLSTPYASTGTYPVQLGGDCRDLYWFRNGVLDYVYSSHVLEDFTRNETEAVLCEWTRVLRVGGRMILLLPDQQRYLEFCRRSGQVHPVTGIVGNPRHAIEDFSLDYIVGIANRLGNLREIARNALLGEYSFSLVLEKSAEKWSEDSPDLASIREKLHRASAERDELREQSRDQKGQIRMLTRWWIIPRVINKCNRMIRGRE